MLDGTIVYKEIPKTITWNVGTFTGKTFVKNGVFYIQGRLLVSSPITAYSTLLAQISDISSAEMYVNSALNRYTLYIAGVGGLLYSRDNIPSGNQPIYINETIAI